MQEALLMIGIKNANDDIGILAAPAALRWKVGCADVSLYSTAGFELSVLLSDNFCFRFAARFFRDRASDRQTATTIDAIDFHSAAGCTTPAIKCIPSFVSGLQ